MQGRSRDADIENRFLDTVGGGESGMNSDSSMETYTLPYVKQIANGKLLSDAGSLGWCSMIPRRVGVGRKIQEAGDMCIPMVYSC